MLDLQHLQCMRWHGLHTCKPDCITPIHSQQGLAASMLFTIVMMLRVVLLLLCQQCSQESRWCPAL